MQISVSSDIKKMISVQKTVILVGILLMLIKAAAYFITNSNLILTDALESIINILAGSLALYSLIFASKPRDHNHPYGHGKIEFISASLEAGLIISAGIIMIGKGIYNLIYPQDIQAIDVGMYLTGGAGLINFILATMLIKQGKKNNSLIMEADGKHLLSDAYSTVGMIIGLAIIFFTDLFWIDNAITILFGSIIIYTGVGILKKSLPGIMDEADTKLLGKIIDVLNTNRKDEWIDLHNLRVIKYGSVYHLDCHFTLPWYYNVKQAHNEMIVIEELIQKNFGKTAEMFIHTDPCTANSCGICTLKTCDVRQHEFKKALRWNTENVSGKTQHNANK